MGDLVPYNQEDQEDLGSAHPDPQAMALHERIRWARKRIGWSQALMGAALGKSKQGVSKWEQPPTKGGTKKHTHPKVDDLKRLAQLTGVNEMWLITGEGAPVPEISLVVVPEEGGFQVPEIAIPDYHSGSPVLRTVSVLAEIPGKAQLFTVPDQAMAPDYLIGDLCFTSSGIPPKPGMDVVARLLMPKVNVFRRYIDAGYSSDGRPQFILEAINPKPGHASFRVHPDEFEILAVVVRHERDLLKRYMTEA